MTLRAWLAGWERVAAAPALVAGMFAMTIALALPLALTLRNMLDTQLGGSLAAETAANGVNWDWWQEFTSQTSGLGTTFQPTIIDFAATLRNTSNVLDGVVEATPVVATLALYLCGWTLFTGGVVDRYARQRPIRAHGFFAAGGVFFFRFLRLAVVAGLLYYLLFVYLHPLLFGRWYPALVRNLDEERVAFGWRMLMYGVFGVLLCAVNMLVDYARIRLVVEDRRSALGALVAAGRFVRQHPGRTAGLYMLNVLSFLAVIALWAAVAAGADRGGAWMWLPVLLTQLYIVARITLKLHFIASQTGLFQASLAHARFVASPRAVWPESPAAELIGGR